MPNNNFPRHGATYQFFENAQVATKSDSADLDNYGRAFYVSDTTSGKSVKVRTVGGNYVTFKNTIVGTIYPISIAQLVSTGTTADEVIVLW